MHHNFDPKSVEQAKAMAASPAGQQLMDALQRIDPTLMEKAQSQISAGNYAQLSKTLAPLLASEEFKQLFRQFGG